VKGCGIEGHDIIPNGSNVHNCNKNGPNDTTAIYDEVEISKSELAGEVILEIERIRKPHIKRPGGERSREAGGEADIVK
jgi:hypothetical protein